MKSPALKPTANKATARKASAKAAKKVPAAVASSNAVARSGPTVADWTILVYMAGDNNLDPFGNDDIREMKSVGSSDKLHLIVQRDTVGASARRLRLRKGTTVAGDSLVELGRVNSGDPAVLQDFLEWGLEAYPAKRTMAVLWNHGNGWDDTDIYEEAKRRQYRPKVRRGDTGEDDKGTDELRSGLRRGGFDMTGAFSPSSFVKQSARGGLNRKRTNRGPFFLTAFEFEETGGLRRAICFDDDAQDFLDNVEMKNVFANVVRNAGRPFDIIGMDACLMSMVETGVQIQGSASFFCGSQEIEPGQGWPYDKILKKLAASVSMNGKQLAGMIAKEFVASYPSTEAVTQSAFDFAALTAVVDATNALGDLMASAWRPSTENGTLKAAITQARFDSQPYEHPDYVDLWDFADKLAALHAPFGQAARAVQKAIETCVFANYAPNRKVNCSHGLSIYLPSQKSISPLYQNLDFGKGGWASFLNLRLT